MSSKKKIAYIVAALVLLPACVVALSYASGLMFFHLNKMPLDMVTPFIIWDYFQIYKTSPIKFIKTTVILCALGPYILLLGGILFAILSKNKQRALHGDARFASLQEIKAAGLIDPPKGLDKTILVGKYKGNYLTYGGFQFVMLAAPTRSGKGVGVVIPNCLNYSDSLVVLDIKLENFDITSGYRKAHGQEVYLFSPFDTTGRTHRYNPLEYISSDPAERLGDVDAIASALYAGNDKDKFWSENAKDLFRGLCLMVLEHPTLPKTLGEVLRQASGKGKPFAEHVNEMIEEANKENRPYSSSCRDALNRILNNSENTMAGIVATFNTPLLIFQNPRVDMATSANDFDLRDVRRKRMTIYLGVTPDKLSDASVLINLFFDQLLNLNTRVLPQQDKSLKYQCLLILDEFTAIGKVNMIQQAISYQAGYNMRVLTIIQNKSQLEDKYGKAGAITLMANHALMIMYAPSPVVQSDANEYSEMLGYETVKSKNKSKSFSGVGGNGSRSESESDQKRALMLPQEIKELGQWREIVSLENCKPILCDKIKYFEDPAFLERINKPVPEIPTRSVNDFIKEMGLGAGGQPSFDNAMNAAGSESPATQDGESISNDEALALMAQSMNKSILKMAKPKSTESDELNDTLAESGLLDRDAVSDSEYENKVLEKLSNPDSESGDLNDNNTTISANDLSSETNDLDNNDAAISTNNLSSETDDLDENDAAISTNDLSSETDDLDENDTAISTNDLSSETDDLDENDAAISTNDLSSETDDLDDNDAAISTNDLSSETDDLDDSNDSVVLGKAGGFCVYQDDPDDEALSESEKNTAAKFGAA